MDTLEKNETWFIHNFDMITTGSTCNCSCTNRIKSTWTMLLVDIPYLGSIWLAYETRPVSAYAGWNEASSAKLPLREGRYCFKVHWSQPFWQSKQKIHPFCFCIGACVFWGSVPLLVLHGSAPLTPLMAQNNTDLPSMDVQLLSPAWMHMYLNKLSHTGCFMKIQILLHCGFERYPVATFHKLPGRWGCCGCFVRDSLFSAAKSGVSWCVDAFFFINILQLGIRFFCQQFFSMEGILKCQKNRSWGRIPKGRGSPSKAWSLRLIMWTYSYLLEVRTNLQFTEIHWWVFFWVFLNLDLLRSVIAIRITNRTTAGCGFFSCRWELVHL